MVKEARESKNSARLVRKMAAREAGAEVSSRRNSEPGKRTTRKAAASLVQKLKGPKAKVSAKTRASKSDAAGSRNARSKASAPTAAQENASLKTATKHTRKSSSIGADNTVGFESIINLWIRCGNLSISINNNFEMSSKCYENALKIEPQNKDAINGFVLSLVKNDQKLNKLDGVFKAIEILNTAMNMYPEVRDDINLWVKLTDYYLLVNELEKAHSVVMTALEFSKNDPQLWLTLGKCLNKLKNTREAIDALTNALFLLPKELNKEEDIDLARSIHLELSSMAFNEGDLELTKSELSIVLSFPKPHDDIILKTCIHLSRNLIISFANSNQILNALWVCEALENIVDNDSTIFLLHSYFSMQPQQNPSYDLLITRKLLISAIKSDPENSKLDSFNDFLVSPEGDFLPWLMLCDCYIKMNAPSIMLECLEISIRKCKSKHSLPIIRETCQRMASSLVKSDDKLIEKVNGIQEFIGKENGPHDKVISLKDLVFLSYEERIELCKPTSGSDIFNKPKTILSDNQSPVDLIIFGQATLTNEQHARNSKGSIKTPDASKSSPAKSVSEVSSQLRQPIQQLASATSSSASQSRSLNAMPTTSPQFINKNGAPLTAKLAVGTGFMGQPYSPLLPPHQSPVMDNQSVYSKSSPQLRTAEDEGVRKHQEELRARQEEEARLYYQNQMAAQLHHAQMLSGPSPQLQPAHGPQHHPYGVMIAPMQGYPPSAYPATYANQPTATYSAQYAHYAQLQQQQAQQAQQQMYQGQSIVAPGIPTVLVNQNYNPYTSAGRNYNVYM